MARSKPSRVSLYDWPRLTRFYGIGPLELAQTPNVITRIYAEQLPELQAEELQSAIMVSDMPHAEDKERRKVFRRIRRLFADDPEPTEKTPDLASTAGKALAGSVGIGVRKGSREKTAPPGVES